MVQDALNIPIDIHVNRLCEWLVSRRHCTREWPGHIAAVRTMINEAIKDMPEHPKIAKILIDASPINYFHCLKIVEILKETEADTKNFLGMYGSQRMKDWQSILKAYERDNLFLAEGGSILSRNVAYELPAMKRSISKAEQSIMDCNKKEAARKKQAHELRDKFLHSSSQLGLKFEGFDSNNPNQVSPTISDVGNQLIKQMKVSLPGIFDSIVNKSRDLDEAVKYYLEFVKYTTDLSDDENSKCLETLRLVISNGNVTTYQWKHGEAPLEVEPVKVDFHFEEESTSDNLEIDFGDLDPNNAGVELETEDIDWGDFEVTDSKDNDLQGVDFTQIDDGVDVSGIIVEDGGTEGGIASGEDALLVLENSQTRNFFIDDIYELEGFLGQRIEEVKNEKASDMVFSGNELSLGLEKLLNFKKKVDGILGAFNETKTKQLLLVRESKSYIVRLAENLLQNLKLARKLDFAAEQEEEKRVLLKNEIEQIKPKINILTKQTRELQTELAKAISVKYNKRVVNIFGGV